MAKPTINKQLVYGIIADTLPMEGRDFVLDTREGPDGKPLMSVKPLTDIGERFVPILVDRLASPLKKDGDFTIVSSVAERSDIETVASIRKRVEEEADDVLNRRIQEAEEAERKAKSALEEAKGSNDSKKLRDARNTLSGATYALAAARRMSSRVRDIRRDVDERARGAAEIEAKSGTDWSVDMDEPLKSLFDRQDISEVMRRKEELVGKIAEEELKLENMRSDAVMSLKYYALPKKGK